MNFISANIPFRKWIPLGEWEDQGAICKAS